MRIMARLSKQELVAIAERLLSDEPLSKAELWRLIAEFEKNTYCQAVELLWDSLDEFPDLPSLVDYALGQEKAEKVPRDELIDVTRKLLTGDFKNEIECSRLCSKFRASIPHPDGTDLIYWPKREFNNAEELVDYALAYRPEGE
jgi:hypothetical protein